MRDLALMWFNKLPLDEQFYKLIEINDYLEGDRVDNHPHRVSDDVKVIAFMFHVAVNKRELTNP